MTSLNPLRERLETAGAVVLDAVANFIRRFVFLTDEQIIAITLWVAHTHAIEKFETTGRLFLTSPERESGKTRALEVVALLVRDPMASVDTSAAGLYRSLILGSRRRRGRPHSAAPT